VVINSRLTMEEHLDQLTSSCASSIHVFALRTLRAHGLRPPQLHHVASLLYAYLTWWALLLRMTSFV